MIGRSLLQPATALAAGAAFTIAIGVTINCAAAASRRDTQNSTIIQNTIAGPPVMAIVAIKDQRVSLYDANGGVIRARVSSGRTDYETPVGVFSVLQKNEEHYSNLYDDASMPFMQRLTWSGIALHGGDLPGYPASHGCVRLPHSYAQDIFPLTKIGLRVIVARDNVAPVKISHRLLLKPAPPGPSAVVTKTTYEASDSENDNPFLPDVRNWPARQAELEALRSIAAAKSAEAETFAEPAEEAKRILSSKTALRTKAAKILRSAEIGKRSADERIVRIDRALADAKKPSAIKKWEDAKVKALAAAPAVEAKLAAATAQMRTADEELARATETSNAAETAKAAAVNAAKEADRKTLPVSLFISLKTQRLYVRQGHEPVFDVPVTVAEPDKPIGTFVYTAVDYTPQGDDLKWTAVSLARRWSNDSAQYSDKNSRRSDADIEPPATDAAAAAAALDRVTLPPEVAQRVAGFVWPGSSLIVSDEPQSKETGKATDHIVVISTEPQGGLKKRPRQPAPSYLSRYEFEDGYYGYGGYRGYGNYGRNYGRQQRYYRPQKPFFFW